jgi:hypothetical protein
MEIDGARRGACALPILPLPPYDQRPGGVATAPCCQAPLEWGRHAAPAQVQAAGGFSQVAERELGNARPARRQILQHLSAEACNLWPLGLHANRAGRRSQPEKEAAAPS